MLIEKKLSYIYENPLFAGCCLVVRFFLEALQSVCKRAHSQSHACFH